MLQIDLDQIGDAAENVVPGGIVGRLGPAENLFDADPQAFLTAFEVFQDVLAGLAGRALIPQFRQRLPVLVLLCRQRLLLLTNGSVFLLDDGKLVFHLGDARLAAVTLGPAFGDPPVQLVASSFGCFFGLPDGLLLRLQPGCPLALGRHLVRAPDQTLATLLDAFSLRLETS